MKHPHRRATEKYNFRNTSLFPAAASGLLRSVGPVTVNRNEEATLRVYGRWDEGGNRPEDLLPWLLSCGEAVEVLAPQEVPLGIITALLGAPFFLWVLRRSRQQNLW